MNGIHKINSKTPFFVFISHYRWFCDPCSFYCLQIPYKWFLLLVENFQSNNCQYNQRNMPNMSHPILSTVVMLPLIVPRRYSPCHHYFYVCLVPFSSIFTSVIFYMCEKVCARGCTAVDLCVSGFVFVWLYVRWLITCRCFGICCVLCVAFPAWLYYFS